MPRLQSPVRHFIYLLYDKNESYRLTDEGLITYIKAFYPKLDLIGYGKARTKIAQWRSEYNTGRFGEPPRMSFRYNGDRRPCNQRLRVLSPEEFQERLSTFKFKDDRYVGTQSETRRTSSNR